MALWGGLALAVLLLGIAIIYNSLIRKAKFADEGWHGIDVQLKRRYDLIPQLVEVTRGYARHEADVLERIVAQRSAMSPAHLVRQEAEGDLQASRALRNLFVHAEAYPELKADTTFLQLQKGLLEVEEAIQNARRYYNATVRDYNTLASVFPCNIVASLFGFRERDFFSVDSAKERKPVSVDVP